MQRSDIDDHVIAHGVSDAYQRNGINHTLGLAENGDCLLPDRGHQVGERGGIDKPPDISHDQNAHDIGDEEYGTQEIAAANGPVKNQGKNK